VRQGDLASDLDLGVALLGALVSAGYRNAIDDKLHDIPQDAADTARQGVANAVQAAGSTGPHAQDLLHAAHQSFIDGWQQAMWAGAAIMGALLVPTRAAPQPKAKDTNHSTHYQQHSWSVQLGRIGAD
jgi:hypothetical protein